MSGIDESGGPGGIDTESAAALVAAAREQATEPATESEAAARLFARPPASPDESPDAAARDEPGETAELTEEAQREGALVDPDARMEALSLATDDELAAFVEHPGGLEALSDSEYGYVLDRLAGDGGRGEQAGDVDADELYEAVALATDQEIAATLEGLDAEQLAQLVELSPMFADRLSDEQIQYAEAKLAQRQAEPAGFDPNDPTLFALDLLGRQKQADDQANEIAAYATGRMQDLESQVRAEVGDDADLAKVRALAGQILPDVMARHRVSGEEAVRVALAAAADRLHEPATESEVAVRMLARQQRGLVIRDPKNQRLSPEERAAARREREARLDREREADEKEHGPPATESAVFARMLRQRERS